MAPREIRRPLADLFLSLTAHNQFHLDLLQWLHQIIFSMDKHLHSDQLTLEAESSEVVIRMVLKEAESQEALRFLTLEFFQVAIPQAIVEDT